MRVSWRQSLRSRIVVYISLILSVSMAVSTVVAFLYFQSIMRNQILHDEKSKLSQLAIQLESQAGDIFSLVNSIAVDAEIQEKIQLRKEDFANEFQRTKNRKEVADRLVFYNTLRNYVATSIIYTVDNEGFNSRAYHAPEFIPDKLSGEALSRYIQKDTQIFSNRYFSTNDSIPVDVLCYKSVLRDFRAPSHQIGTIYLEIFSSYFLQPLQKYGQDYTDVIWRNSDGEMLYQKNTDGISLDNIEAPLAVSGATRFPTGYLVSQPIQGAGWDIGVYITDQEIASRSQFMAVFFVLFFFLTLALMILIILPVLEKTVRPIKELTDVMYTVRAGNLAVHPYTNSQDEIAVLYKGFNEMIEDISRYMNEQKQYEEQKKEMEFAILISQINPHYLYNVLNTVVYLAAEEENDRIVEVVNALIGVLQENLKIGEKSIYTTVEDELRVIDSYLTIQRYRYPDKMSFHLDVDDALLGCLIPKTIIQPLVENALYHGLTSKEGKGNIWLSISSSSGYLQIVVRDDGIGMDEESIRLFENAQGLDGIHQERPRIGIANIRDRIRFVYGDAGKISIEAQAGQYTMVTIILPYPQGQ